MPIPADGSKRLGNGSGAGYAVTGLAAHARYSAGRTLALSSNGRRLCKAKFNLGSSGLFAVFLVIATVVCGVARAQTVDAAPAPGPSTSSGAGGQTADVDASTTAPRATSAATSGAAGTTDAATPAASEELAVRQPPSSITLPHDLSPRAMFLNADIVVKAVMVGLALASLLTWVVWLAKSLELLAAKMRLRRSVRTIVEAASLSEASRLFAKRGGAAGQLVRVAQHETDRSAGRSDRAGGEGILQRVASHLSRVEAQAARRMSRGTGLLATIGSTAPFIGLFGTVWGIMNAFIGISRAQTTNLAIVAPGTAEALLATATGLVAAIPAVIIYNVFARSIGGYRQLLADAAAGVERLVSRDLDFRRMPPGGGTEHPQAHARPQPATE